MIIEYIERLRQQPLSVRREAVRFWTAVIVVIVVALYLTVVGVKSFIVLDPTPAATIVAPYQQNK